MPRTKIVATIGPATNNPETIRKMLHAGMNVARMNFSHGSHESHEQTFSMLRRVAQEEGKVLGILADLQGPKLRLGHVRVGGIQLARGDEVVLTSRPGQPAMLHLPHPELIAAVHPGARLVIGDGEVELVVSEKRSDAISCVTMVPGLLESRKGVSVPGTSLMISSITDKDKQDLDFICSLNLDFVALSFVRSADDIHELRELLGERGARRPIIAKIEKSEAIERLESIRDAADGLMVARGDLGIDMPAQEVPLLQKRIIRACNETGKPVITATQMLQSMVEHPRPTRAEASDVANAILDGTDAVMLSGETAAGQYPVESVMMMRNIAEITEKQFPYEMWRQRRRQSDRTKTSVTEAISAACCAIAEELSASYIVCTTMSGLTARKIARYRPATPILAVSPLPETQRRMALVWGVEGILAPNFEDTADMLNKTVETIKPVGLSIGERLVISAGVPFGETGHTNLIQVHEIE